ncbi:MULTISPECIES: head maturation protease, ClpP-related [unclassified Paenibacillus]|uniref:head maturation protease, ClpP-related n=1 Tax=unclassified Paenibacillus TaxID=185978 RepID=UPI0030F5D9D2
MSKFWSFKNLSDEEAELRIEGEIISDDDAWFYEWLGIPAASPNTFKTQLAEFKGKNITVWVDSWGGDVFAAMGIYNALQEHKKQSGHVVAKITKGVSAGSIIPMAADEILISPGGIMMAHNPWTQAQGEYKDMIKAAEVLNEVKEAILNIYEGRTKSSREHLSQLMDETTWMSAQKAVNEKFADGILYQEGGTDPVQNSFSFSMKAIQNSTDSAMRRFFEQWQKVNPAAGGAESAPQNKNAKESDDVPITNIEELKNEYPQLYNQLVDQVTKDAVTAERNRIKEIEEIANTVSPELVNKAKYEEPMNAEKLAFLALKQDAGRGEAFINARQQELQNNGGIQSQTPLDGDQKKVQEAAQIDAIANAMNAQRGGMEAKN